MLKIIQTIITLLIVASLILQILVLLGNFSGLQSVNILRIELENPPSNGGSILSDIFSAANSAIVGMPNYFTVALFVLCEGKSNNVTVCTPSSFGYRCSTLQTIENQIPGWAHSTVSGVQAGVFITSAILCFILLYCNFYHQYTGHRIKHEFDWCRKILMCLVALIALLFCFATFAAQIVAYNIVKKDIKSALFGGLLDSLVTLNTLTGTSIWMSLAASISLFFVTILLFISICCMGNKSRSRKEESYEMDQI